MATCNSSEAGLWRKTAIVMLMLSALFFFIQRTSLAMFDPIFEVCIFHIPTLAGTLIYYFIRRRKA
jgi:hypothetical protein